MNRERSMSSYVFQFYRQLNSTTRFNLSSLCVEKGGPALLNKYVQKKARRLSRAFLSLIPVIHQFYYASKRVYCHTRLYIVLSANL